MPRDPRVGHPRHMTAQPDDYSLSDTDSIVYGKLAEASALYDQYLQVADVARTANFAQEYVEIPPAPAPLTLALRIFDQDAFME